MNETNEPKIRFSQSRRQIEEIRDQITQLKRQRSTIPSEYLSATNEIGFRDPDALYSDRHPRRTQRTPKTRKTNPQTILKREKRNQNRTTIRRQNNRKFSRKRRGQNVNQRNQLVYRSRRNNPNRNPRTLIKQQKQNQRSRKPPNFKPHTRNTPVPIRNNFSLTTGTLKEYYSVNLKSGSFDHVNVSGREYLTTLIINTNTNSKPFTPGYRVFILPINPNNLKGMRLRTDCRNYQFFKFKRFIVHYVTSLPSTTDGAFVHSFNHNVDYNSTVYSNNSDVLLREQMALEDSQMTSLYNNTSLSMKCSDFITEWFQNDVTIADPDSAYQGIYEFAMATTVTPYTGSNTTETLGLLYIEYDCELLGRQDEDYTPSTSLSTFSSNINAVGQVFSTYTAGLIPMFTATPFLLVFLYQLFLLLLLGIYLYVNSFYKLLMLLLLQFLLLISLKFLIL